MKTKLTLRMDERLIKRAKRHAQRQGTSVSQMVADYFALIQEPAEARPSARETSRLVPAGYEYSEFTKSLTGAFGEADDHVETEDAYREHLEEKHR